VLHHGFGVPVVHTVLVAFPAFLDTCALFPIRLADILLRLPDYDHAYRPLWSAHVLDELESNLVENLSYMTPDKAARRVNAMRDHFPDAMVTGYEKLIPMMTCDQKDRHVLAAAVMGNAEVIVTANLKDFLPEALKPYDLGAKHPDDFLLDQLDLYPEVTGQAVVDAVGDRRNPAVTLPDFLFELEKLVPKFAVAVGQVITRTL
jgi:predicted nucleic acid-binding protein